MKKKYQTVYEIRLGFIEMISFGVHQESQNIKTETTVLTFVLKYV